VGPRQFNVGDIVYGGDTPGIHQNLGTLEEARAALKRIKAEGGPTSISYKNYEIHSRFVSIATLISVIENLSQSIPTKAAIGSS
jgi:hypothetical protein